jgi:hypothetical protein
MSKWIYTPESQTLDTDFVVSAGRVKVTGIHISNKSETQTAVVSCSDKNGNTIQEITVLPLSSYTLAHYQPTDYDSGLTLEAFASGGTDVRATVTATRDL